MSNHNLKIFTKYFDALASGAKTFEYRFNDRAYQVDDMLLLQEIDRETLEYSGRQLYRIVSYILSCGDGMVILALQGTGVVHFNSQIAGQKS